MMKRHENRERFILLVSVGTLLCGITVVWALKKIHYEERIEPPPVIVSAIRPERRDLARRIVLPALLESSRTVTVVPKVSGTLLETAVEEGTPVREGEVIARIDPGPYALELRSAEAAWLFADNSLARMESLSESSGTSRQRLEEAQASRDAALASYELARMRLGYCDVVSPMDGIVLARYADPGNLASESSPLFLVCDPGSLRVEALVPEKFWDAFSGNGEVSVRLSRPYDEEDVRSARILRVGPGISPEAKTFGVTCVPEPGGEPWPVGSRLSVEFVLEERPDACSLPMRALSGDGALWRIVEEDSTVRRLEAGGFFSDGERIALPEEWAGFLFVLDGHHRLADGQAVEPIDGGS